MDMAYVLEMLEQVDADKVEETVAEQEVTGALTSENFFELFDGECKITETFHNVTLTKVGDKYFENGAECLDASRLHGMLECDFTESPHSLRVTVGLENDRFKNGDVEVRFRGDLKTYNLDIYEHNRLKEFKIVIDGDYYTFEKDGGFNKPGFKKSGLKFSQLKRIVKLLRVILYFNLDVSPGALYELTIDGQDLVLTEEELLDRYETIKIFEELGGEW